MSAAILQLRAGKAAVSIAPEFGGLVTELVLPTPGGPRNVIDGVAPDQLPENPGYRSAVLFPSPNRLRDGRYRFAGKDYQFAVNEAATQTALHQFLWRLPAEVTAEHTGDDSHSATLLWRYDASEPGYPFKADIRITFMVAATGAFAMAMEVENTDSVAIPVGLGWHPYYTLGVAIDDCSLHLPQVQRVEIDKRMLPTDNLLVDDRFAELAPIGAMQLDDCFVLDGSNAGEQQVKLWSDAAGFGLALWQQAGPSGMNFVQLYIPPDRQSLAVEPMSCGIDALNTEAGLVVLEPGQRYHANFGVRVITEI